MKIGIVDLDTSHPAAWVPIERSLGHEVVAVLDRGTVHPPGYARRFAAEHNIPRVFDSIDEMVPHVDCAIIHSCNWDVHVQSARPFIEAGKAALVDKPIAGNLQDIRQLRTWAEQGARISGGSSLRFCDETKQWLAKPTSERGTPAIVMCGCGVDEFNYGIHAYSMLSGIIGSGAHSVRHLGQGAQRRVQIRYSDGRTGIVAVGQAAAWLPFYATVVTERSVSQFIAESGKLYRALLESVFPFLEGKAPAPLLPDAWIEPELCALAAMQSWTSEDCDVSLTGLDASTCYDGKTFAESYRKSRYPNGW